MSSCNCLLALEFHSNCKCTRTNAAAAADAVLCIGANEAAYSRYDNQVKVD